MSVEVEYEEKCIKYCRRSIQLALVLMLILSSVAIIQLVGLSVGSVTKSLMTLLPIYIVISIIWLTSLRKKIGVSSSAAILRIVMEDELRAQSLNRAFRSAFLVVLIAQLPIALLFSVNTLASAAIIQSIVTAVLSVASFLTFFLIYDR